MGSVPRYWITKVASIRAAEWLPTCTGAQSDHSVHRYQGLLHTALRNTWKLPHTVTFIEPQSFLCLSNRQERMEMHVHNTAPRWHINSQLDAFSTVGNFLLNIGTKNSDSAPQMQMSLLDYNPIHRALSAKTEQWNFFTLCYRHPNANNKQSDDGWAVKCFPYPFRIQSTGDRWIPITKGQ